MDKNIKTVLNGVRLWVMSKISDINTTITNLINELKQQTENRSFVISRHINELYDLVVYSDGKNIEIDDERNISATGYTHNKSNNSIADGEHTVARNTGEHATGKYNKSHRFYQSPNVTFIDLGLPSGTLWAKYNLGANSENTPGNRYAFAEITTKSTFTWDTYTSHAVVHTVDEQKIVKLTKYCPANKSEYWETGTPDNILKIENIDDAVYNTEVYEQLWNIPTTEQFKELIANTNKKLVQLTGGVYALEFRNKNQDLSIEVLRIPIFGIQMNETPFANNTQTQYWSSDINTENPLEGICLKIVKTGNGESNYTITNFTNQSEIKNACLQRFGGAFIRPVSQKIPSDGTQFSVGIGTQLERKNAMEVSNNGDIYVYGIGNYDGTKTVEQDISIESLQQYISYLEQRIYDLEESVWGETCMAIDTVISLSSGITKLIQDITYDDELLVWDFDNGQFTSAKPLWIKKQEISSRYYLCKLSDGTEIKLVGTLGKSHRLFNYTDQIFEYPQNCIGKEIFTENGIVTLLSCELINESIEYYNIITNYHINLFANGILTSCRYNNIYQIDHMKFIKDERENVSYSEYTGIPEKYYIGMRLGEQTIPIEETKKYIRKLINKEK